MAAPTPEAPASESATTTGAPAPTSQNVAPGDEEHTPEGKLLVLKVGTSTLMASDEDGQHVRLANIAQLVELIALLKRRRYEVVLVSSGAVGMGCIKLGLARKPTEMSAKQAVAAAGQSKLMRMYEDLFGTVRLTVAQLLVSQSDFLDKHHWANVKRTVQECLRLDMVPIINENDSTNTTELRFGDNDNLAALTAVQLHAAGLYLFTDVDFLYTSNPRVDPTATALRVVDEPWSLQVDTRLPGSALGTGGMQTKVVAARTASCAGIPCGLINGAHPARLLSFLAYQDRSTDGEGAYAKVALPEGTLFMAISPAQRVSDTRRWILSLPPCGELVINDGAAGAVASGKNLLAVGVMKVSGRFIMGEAVRIKHRGKELGRAIVNFNDVDIGKIQGSKAAGIEQILGFVAGAEVCHRDNIVLNDYGCMMRFDASKSDRRATAQGERCPEPTGRRRSQSWFGTR